MAKPIIDVTDLAKEKIEELLKARGKPSLGIRIGLRTKGCSGLSYTFEYADHKQPHDEEVSLGQFSILIDPKAILFLLGTTIDYEETKLESGFKFINPNEKGRCGCGESFHV